MKKSSQKKKALSAEKTLQQLQSTISSLSMQDAIKSMNLAKANLANLQKLREDANADYVKAKAIAESSVKYVLICKQYCEFLIPSDFI